MQRNDDTRHDSVMRHTSLAVSAKRVLIVEDDTSVRIMVGAVLRREGFQVEQTTTADQAIRSIDADNFDAVVLDVTIAGGRGFDVLHHLAASRPDAQFVIVISTGTPASLDHIVSPVIAAKLRKPFDIRQLVAAVRKCTGA